LLWMKPCFVGLNPTKFDLANQFLGKWKNCAQVARGAAFLLGTEERPEKAREKGRAGIGAWANEPRRHSSGKPSLPRTSWRERPFAGSCLALSLNSAPTLPQ